MEWPSSRVDKFAGGTITLGFGFLYVTDPVSAHHWRVAIAFWIVGLLIFICGFPVVQRRLRVVQGKLVAFYKQAAILSPRAVPIGAVTLIILTVVLLFDGVWRSLSKSDIESYLAIDSVNDPLSFVPQIGQAAQPKVRKFVQIRVTNIGKESIRNMKVTVITVSNRDTRWQLPLASRETLFVALLPSPALGQVNLNPGDDQLFDALVECNGTVCPDGELAIPHIENGVRFFGTFTEHGMTVRPTDLTVRASGDIGNTVTKTFIISLGAGGQLILNPKSDDKG